MSVFAIAILFVSSAVAQVGQIRVEPVPYYSQSGRYIDFSVQCNDNLIGLKGIHIDLDIDTAVVSFVPDSIRLGDMFVDNDTLTFFYQRIAGDSTRLTVDIAVLEDSATVSGPGNILFFTLFTRTFGESDIALNGLDVRDRFNQPIPTEELDGHIRVCQFVGDVNADNEINIADLTYLVGWSFRRGPDPIPLAAGDVDCNSSHDIADIAKLVGFMFRGGSLCGPCVN